jgi:hypothetical protein
MSQQEIAMLHSGGQTLIPIMAKQYPLTFPTLYDFAINSDPTCFASYPAPNFAERHDLTLVPN